MSLEGKTHSLWNRLKHLCAAALLSCALSSKADAVPGRESFPYILHMNSGEDYFVSQHDHALIIHAQDGTGVGWFKRLNFVLDGVQYSLNESLESSVRPQTVYQDSVPVGMISLNSESRAPEDSIPPRFVMHHQQDLQDNNFLNHVFFLLEMTTEPGTSFTISCNGARSKVFASSATLAVPVMLDAEENTIEISSTDLSGNTTCESLSIRTGGEQFEVNGILYNACRSASQNREENPAMYEALARTIHEMNASIRNPKYRVTRVNIPYLNSIQFLCPHHPLHVDSGGTRDGWHLGRDFIYIGHGNFTQYQDTRRRLRDVYTHEFGHHVHDLLSPGDKRQMDQMYQDILSCQPDTRNIIFRYLFYDGKYEERTDVGHPWDNPSELFASVFHITTNYGDELLELLRMQNPKVQALAQRVIDFVVQQQAH
ncbi:hypothetical protein HY490_04835 [Candidatus Woesearchaeota archaeon]|nr:hypothetical protein [Candidatus Woesearchaeota archaeon]